MAAIAASPREAVTASFFNFKLNCPVTDKPNLQLPRHIPTLPRARSRVAGKRPFGIIPAPMAGDDFRPAIDATGCHRQQWPKSRPLDNHCDRQLDDRLAAIEDAIAIRPGGSLTEVHDLTGCVRRSLN